MYKALILFLFFLSTYISAEENFYPVVPQVCKQDESYRFLELDNGLKALLISNPLLDEASVSLSINVGSRDDPKEVQGMAHLAEHMLFLGSKKYPKAKEYHQFLSQHGGYSNATTSYGNTTYYFSIRNDYLEEALDRFVNQFISPRIEAKYVDSERRVVEAEYNYRKSNYSRRIDDVFNHIMGMDHPLTRFSSGNKVSLGQFSSRKLAQEIKTWLQTYYSADLMHLVIESPEELDKLTGLVKTKFEEIEVKKVPSQNTPPLHNKAYPGLAKVFLNDTENYMVVKFPIPEMPEVEKYAVEEYLSYLYELKYADALVSNLTSYNYISELDVAFSTDERHSSTVDFYIDLSYYGGQKYWDVLRRVFAYTETLKGVIHDKWRFDEFLKRRELDWCYSRPTVVDISENLGKYGAEFSIGKGYTASSFNPEKYRLILDSINPKNMLAMVANPDFSVGKKSYWYKTDYSFDTLTESDLKHYKSDKPLYVYPAKKNPYFPEEMLSSTDKVEELPLQLEIANNVDAWFGQNTTYKDPSAYFYFLIRSPEAQRSRRNSAYTTLIRTLIEDQLEKYLGAVEDAGAYFNMTKVTNGFGIYLSGQSGSIDKILPDLLDTISRFKINDRNFSGYRYGWKKHLEEPEKVFPQSRANQLINQLVHTPVYSNEEMAKGMGGASYSGLYSFFKKFRKEMLVTSLAYGNLNKDDAVSWNKMLQEKLTLTKDNPTVEESILKVENGVNRIIEETEYSDSLNSVYMQGDSVSIEAQAKYKLLAAILDSSYFSELRTQEHLGYVVNVTEYQYFSVPGLKFTVRSPSHGAHQLEKATLDYLSKQGEEISKLSDIKFSKFKQAVLDNLKNDTDTLDELTGYYWDAIRGQSLSV